MKFIDALRKFFTPAPLVVGRLTDKDEALRMAEILNLVTGSTAYDVELDNTTGEWVVLRRYFPR